MSQAPINGLASPYLDGVLKGVLRYQSCLDCSAAQTLARYACYACRGGRLAWKEATGNGTVYALSVISRAPNDSFRALVPYTLVLVVLDEGPRMMGHGQVGLKIGDRVFGQAFKHDGAPLIMFTPLSETCPN